MTRRYFSNPNDVDFFRSSRGMISQLSQERSLPLAISHANREESRNCPIGRHGNRPSPPQEADLEATGTQPRRRIAVACGRCRKRKIKCSGDPGTGGGCQNCKQAGAANQCMFLRVNSETLDVQQPSEWTNVGSMRSSPAETQYAPVTSSAVSSLGSGSSNGSSRRYTQMSYPQGYAAGSYLTKSQLNTFYGMGYNDDLTEPYGIQSPPFMLPSQDSLGGAYSPHDSLRTWNPISQGSKTSDAGLFLEQEYPSAYGSNHTSYLPSSMSKMPAITPDGSSYFPGLTSLASSLPSTSSVSDRVLPNPERLVPSHMNMTSLNQSIGNGVSLAGGYSYKSTASWDPDGSDVNTSQNGTMTNNASNLMGPPNTKNSSSALHSSLSYDPSSNSPAQTSSLANSATSLPAPIVPQHNFPGSATSMFPAASSNEALLPSHNSSSNLYSYSSEGASRRDSQGESSPSEGTLMNGRQYVRIRQPQPQSLQGANSLENMRRTSTSLELRPQTVHRTSIPSSSSNIRGY
ncbi:MAG: hypothetical protein M1812_003588 [Candelaria pacifica]|nr:MAG: hypothetical protein M1812_003588 [Candelaria pacifica]